MKALPCVVRDKTGNEIAGLVLASPVRPDGRSKHCTFVPYGGLNSGHRRSVLAWLVDHRPDLVTRHRKMR